MALFRRSEWSHAAACFSHPTASKGPASQGLPRGSGRVVSNAAPPATTCDSGDAKRPSIPGGAAVRGQLQCELARCWCARCLLIGALCSAMCCSWPGRGDSSTPQSNLRERRECFASHCVVRWRREWARVLRQIVAVKGSHLQRLAQGRGGATVCRC